MCFHIGLHKQFSFFYIRWANHYTYFEAGMYTALARLVFSRVVYFRGYLKKTDYSNLSTGRITGFVFERMYYCRLCFNEKCQFSDLVPPTPWNLQVLVLPFYQLLLNAHVQHYLRTFPSFLLTSISVNQRLRLSWSKKQNVFMINICE